MRFLVLCTVLLLAVMPARAQEATAADAAAIRAVITDQLAAFNRDDGNTAWSFAAPNIQARFQTVEVFMAMVRGSYATVYRSRAAEFGTLTGSGDHLLQEVTITGQDGLQVLARYQMGRQEDASWKIEGVSLKELPQLNV
jgi:hypothetical protein